MVHYINLHNLHHINFPSLNIQLEAARNHPLNLEAALDPGGPRKSGLPIANDLQSTSQAHRRMSFQVVGSISSCDFAVFRDRKRAFGRSCDVIIELVRLAHPGPSKRKIPFS